MNPIENIIETTMTQLKQMVDVNTIVGEAFVTPGGCTIIPISKVSFGFVSGGGEYSTADRDENHNFPFAGGAASGISIMPVAFMAADGCNIKLLTANNRNALDKLVENSPQILSEIAKMIKNVTCTCSEAKEKDEKKETEESAR